MTFLPLFQSDRHEFHRAQSAAGPAAPGHPTVQADLVDPSHGLALGYEAALPHLLDFPVEGASRAG